MNNLIIEKIKKPYFIGIGGIGVSAVAQMFLQQNIQVSGSDSNDSPVISELKEKGAKVFIGHDALNLPSKCDLIIYTNAIPKDNIELIEARKRNITTLSYPEMLGEISKDFFTIAISGNAGKTTTTAMLGQVLIDANLDPTIIVGSLANFTNPEGKIMRTNFVFGKGKYFIVEADEYKKAFLNLSPQILVITNIAEDHLDYYKDLKNIQDAFAKLANKVPKNGFIICSSKDKNISPILNNVCATVLDYQKTSIDKYSIPVSGEHNRDNVKAVATLASNLGVKDTIIEKSIKNFKGAWRRFEYKGETKNGALIYDDYAHNPSKIRALIAGTKEKYPEKRIVILFQPHLYSRTKHMLEDLAISFLGVDKIIISPIYAARENVDVSISHNMLADAILATNTVPHVEVINSLNEARPLLESEGGETICLTVGAGDVYTVANKILNSGQGVI